MLAQRLLIVTPFVFSTRTHIRAASVVREIDFSCDSFGVWCCEPILAQQRYLLSNFQKPHGFCATDRGAVAAFTWQEYFRMVMFFRRIVLIFDALTGPRHSVDLVMERLQSLEDAVKRWVVRNGWEIDVAMQNFPQHYEAYLNTSSELLTKALAYEEIAVSMMFPRYRFPGATGLEYQGFMARCNQLRAQWIDSTSGDMAVHNQPTVDGAGLDRFRALMIRLNGVAEMARGIRSVTAIDKQGNFLNPAGQLTADKDVFCSLVANIGADFEFEISLMDFISAHPIACEQHFRGLLPLAVHTRNACTETISGVIDLLCPLDEGNSVTEFLSLQMPGTLVVAA
jgi:hypothetical protein